MIYCLNKTLIWWIYTVFFFLCREKGPDDKGKQKKKVKEKKTTKLKTKDGEDDSGGWTEVKGSSSSAAVCNPLFTSCVKITIAYMYTLV